MSRLAIPSRLVAELDRHATTTYPEECCGVLIGRRLDEDSEVVWHVTEVLRTDNVHPSRRGTRYSIAHEQLLVAHQGARASRQQVVGYYHSHPDRPARPSAADLEAAAPGVSYLILSVERGRVRERRAWRLPGAGAGFVEEILEPSWSGTACVIDDGRQA